MRDVLSFHPTAHGDAVRFVSGRADVIERHDAAVCGGGIAFSARPVKPGQKVCLELRQRTGRRRSRQLPGSLRLGFTTLDPATLLPSQLPPYVIPDLTDTGRCWAAIVGPRVFDGSQICVTLDASGTSAVWNVDGVDRGVLVDGFDVSGPLWLTVDLFGPVSGVRLVSTGW